MESFALFRKHLAMSGIYEQQSLNNNLRRFNLSGFNLYNSAIIIFGNFYVISLTKLLDEVNTFEDYMSIIYIVLSSLVLIISYIIIVLKTPALFRLIKSFEKIITKSRYSSSTRGIYSKLLLGNSWNFHKKNPIIKFIKCIRYFIRNSITSRTVATIRQDQPTYSEMDKSSAFNRCNHFTANVYYNTVFT